MCFGNMQTSNNTTTTTTPPSWLTGAAQSNLGYAQNLQSSGFTPYTGQQVANFAPQQQQSFDAGNSLYNSVTGGPIGSAISNVANAPAQSVSANTIASQMSPYMNAYVGQALAPQVSNLNNQMSLQSQLTQGQATSAGAFGDPRATMLQQNQNAANSLQEQGLVGNAYTSAFNTAIGAGAQDVSNNLNAQTTNANLANTQLQNQLSAANAQYGMQSGATGLLNTLGGQQTAQTQSQLNAAYNQYLMAQQYPFQTTQLMDQTLGASTAGAPMTSNSTTQTPNNAGYGILGSIAGAALAPMTGGLSLLPSAMSSMSAYAPGGSASGATPSYQNGGIYPMYADGGKVDGKKPIIVGERGPEVFVPGKKGLVVPNEILEAAREKRKAKTGAADGLSRQLGIAA